jgi:hypothetical protein
MTIRPSVKLPGLERMADFTMWGAAIAEALGDGRDSFLSAYSRNIGAQNAEAIEGHIVGNAVLALMAGRDSWRGTPTELLDALEKAALNGRQIHKTGNGRVDTKGWPGAPHILSRRLKEVKSNLADAGMVVLEDRDDARTIEIARLQGTGSSVGSDGQTPKRQVEPDGTDASDATSANQPVVVVL